MPRSPLITGATQDLAGYFGALTDPDFIDRTWESRIVAKANRDVRATDTTATANADLIAGKLSAYADISRALSEPVNGKSGAAGISDLINGAVSLGDFLSSDVDPKYSDEFKIYGILTAGFSNSLLVNCSFKDISGVDAPETTVNTSVSDPTRLKPNAYIINVSNPAMGPATRDVGPLEVFMNSMPTLELSKCVPYVNVELITSRPGRDDAGNFSAPTLLRFLNPSKPSAVDVAMLDAQKTEVASEATKLGTGTRSGMELFTAPQTLVNLGPTGEEYVPIIDRMRPLATLGDLSISVKMQKNTSMFSQIRMEVVVHDRSRLREVADLVRPDLYARTFIDITYGWSHPEGGPNSNNKFGKFLDAMKVEGRYRIASSTYSFEEGGAVKISLNLFSLGSIDMLSLTCSSAKSQLIELDGLVQKIRKALENKRAAGLSAPAMARFDFVNSITDPSSLLRAASDASFMKALDPIQGDGENIDLNDELVKALTEAIGEVTLKGPAGAKQWAVINNNNLPTDEQAKASKFATKIKSTYEEIINKIPTMGGDKVSDDLFAAPNINRLKAMMHEPRASKDQVKEKFKGFVSLGSAMAALVAWPLADSGLFDEIQLVFYPFNDFAGGVHGCPISWFPIDKQRLITYVQSMVTQTPEISLNNMIELINARFVNFSADQAYLMADFYDPDKIKEDDKIEYKDGTIKINDADNKLIDVKYEVAYPIKLEERLKGVGIYEGKFTQPMLGVFTEGCPLLDATGAKIPDSLGRSKTLLKIHIFDAASTAYRTLGELLAATRDEQLGVILGAVSTANREISANPTSNQAIQRRPDLNAVLDAGRQAGILRELSVPTIADTGVAVYSVEGSYESIKRLVAAGMPTITYGSSTSAITNASFSTANSAAMSNAMIARSFQPAGEAPPSQVEGGVPMQLVPAAVSLNTFGCPLFSPMQRIFIDFGTGTSIDNVYYVLGAEHKIGQSGFTTDVKLGYGEGFTTFTSLSQNLSLLATRVNDAVNAARPAAQPAGASPAGSATPAPSIGLSDQRDALQAIRDAKMRETELYAEAGRAIGKSLAPAARVELQVEARVAAELQKAKDALAQKAEAAKEDATKKLQAAIPPEALNSVTEAQKKAKVIEAQAAVVAADVATAASITNLVLNADQLIAQVGPEAAAVLLASAQAELRSQLEAAPPKPPTK